MTPSSDLFILDEDTGEIHLQQELVHIEEAVKQWRFVLTATESESNLQTETDVNRRDTLAQPVMDHNTRTFYS